MDHSLFISDLHLCESRPEIINAFTSFLETTASKASSLYILGDLFEYWAGDDAIAPGAHRQSIEALKKLSQSGVSVFLIRGNRDFLLGGTFSQATGVSLLPDPSVIAIHGHSILISHGDTLCTDDVAYQQFRSEVRTQAWMDKFLSQPLNNRIQFIESIRQKSEQEKSVKSMEIMDVNADAVASLFAEHNYPPSMIHGHTHRPKRHQHTFKGESCERWVLGDWYGQGSYLRVDQDGINAHTLPQQQG